MRFILAGQESRKFTFQQDKVTIDAFVMCLFTHHAAIGCVECRYSYRRRLLLLPFFWSKAMREPLTAGKVTITVPASFFVVHHTSNHACRGAAGNFTFMYHDTLQ